MTRNALTACALAAGIPTILLAQARPPLLDTVTVVASRTGLATTSRSVDVVTRDEIVHSTARTVADVLASRLGVDVYSRSPAQADLSLRGSTSDQVVVLVDGHRVSDVQSSHYTLDLALPLESVERIEILRGTGAALYGADAIGGVVNIVTRQAAVPAAALRAGRFGTGGGSVAYGRTNGAASLSASGDFEKSDGHRAGMDYRDGQARLTLVNRAAGGSLRTNLGVGVRDFGANAFYGPYNSIERTGTTTVDSRWQRELASWDVSLAAGTREHSDHYVLLRDDPSVYQNLHESWQTNGELAARTIRGPMAIALGGDAAHHQLSSARLGGRREWRAGAFVEATAGGQSRATLDAGARADRSSLFGAYVSPSLAATLRADEHLQLRASGALGFRAPTWTERYYTDPINQGDSTLGVERFRSGEVGAVIDAAGMSLDLAGFARHAENLIDWVRPATAPATAMWHATNVGRAEYRGAEVALRLPAVAGLTSTLFGSGLRFTDDQGAALAGKYALRPVTEQLGGRVARSWSNGFDLAADAMLARRATERRHVTGNLRASWRYGALSVTLDATNLANASWLDASGEPVAGRAFFVGLGWIGRAL